MNSVHTENSTSGNQQAIPGWFSFKGRYTRAQFWGRYLLAVIVYSIFAPVVLTPSFSSLYLSIAELGDTDKLLLVSTIALLAEAALTTALYIPLMVKRFHDFGQSAATPLTLWGIFELIHISAETWGLALAVNSQDMEAIAIGDKYYEYALILRIVLVLVLLGIMLRDSQRGTNKYGPSTKYPDETAQPYVTEQEPPLPRLPQTEEKQHSPKSGCLTMFFIFLGIGAVLAIGLYLLKAGPDAIRYTMIAYGGSIAAYIQTMRQKKK